MQRLIEVEQPTSNDKNAHNCYENLKQYHLHHYNMKIQLISFTCNKLNMGRYTITWYMYM